MKKNEKTIEFEHFVMFAQNILKLTKQANDKIFNKILIVIDIRHNGIGLYLERALLHSFLHRLISPSHTINEYQIVVKQKENTLFYTYIFENRNQSII